MDLDGVAAGERRATRDTDGTNRKVEGPLTRYAPEMVVMPPTHRLVSRLPRMMAISAAIAVFSGVTGLYASYFFNGASDAAIVLACTACFVLASVIAATRRRSAGEVEGFR